MIETLLQVENGSYPFDESIGKNDLVKVQDIQMFSSVKALN